MPRRLNEAFFQKLQEFGGERGKEKSNESQPAAPDLLSRSKSVKGRRRSSEVDSDDVRRITNPKRRNSSIQDERSIHDAYHAILNEYNRVGVYSARSDDICHVILLKSHPRNQNTSYFFSLFRESYYENIKKQQKSKRMLQKIKIGLLRYAIYF